jgi:ABC-type multidrug transport system ATPase subunit
LNVQHLFKRYDTIRAVNDLSFSVNKGEIFGLLGPNGSGKSTTIRIMLSLVKADSGEITLFNEQISSQNFSVRKRMGALIESPDFYEYLPAYDNLRILSDISGKKITKRSILDKLDLVGLSDFAFRKVKIFSHGMKQRLGIAQSLLGDPELIILDEPANGLDPHGIIDIRKLILNLSRELHITIILSSHILKEVELMADRMIVMNHGNAIMEGNVKELIGGKDNLIKMIVNDPFRAIGILKSSGINEVSVNEFNELIIRSRDLNSGYINKVLVQNGIEVNEISPARSLEDLYIQVTENALESNKS